MAKKMVVIRMESWIENLDQSCEYEVSAFRCYEKETWDHICSSMSKYEGKIKVPLGKNLYIIHENWNAWKGQFYVEDITPEQILMLERWVNDQFGAIEAFDWLENMRKYEIAIVK